MTSSHPATLAIRSTRVVQYKAPKEQRCLPLESPSKGQLEDALANVGCFAAPEIHKIVQDVDHVDPKNGSDSLLSSVNY
jgi:hypothetical protein